MGNNLIDKMATLFSLLLLVSLELCLGGGDMGPTLGPPTTYSQSTYTQTVRGHDDIMLSFKHAGKEDAFDYSDTNMYPWRVWDETTRTASNLERTTPQVTSCMPGTRGERGAKYGHGQENCADVVSMITPMVEKRWNEQEDCVCKHHSKFVNNDQRLDFMTIAGSAHNLDYGTTYLAVHHRNPHQTYDTTSGVPHNSGRCKVCYKADIAVDYLGAGTAEMDDWNLQGDSRYVNSNLDNAGDRGGFGSDDSGTIPTGRNWQGV